MFFYLIYIYIMTTRYILDSVGNDIIFKTRDAVGETV